MAVTHIVTGNARSDGSWRVWKINPRGSVKTVEQILPFAKTIADDLKVYAVAAAEPRKRKFRLVQVTFTAGGMLQVREYDADDWCTVARHENGDARVIAIKKGRETVATVNADVVIAVQGIA